MVEKLCETGCREDLLFKIDERPKWSVLLKVVVIVITIITFSVLLAVSLHSAGQAERDAILGKNNEQIQVNTLAIALIKRDLEIIKQGQNEMKSTSATQFETLLKELKAQKGIR